MYAIIENGVVVNVVLWDGDSEWQPPAGTTAVEVTETTGAAFVGLPYANGHFTAPTPTPPTSI